MRGKVALLLAITSPEMPKNWISGFKRWSYIQFRRKGNVILFQNHCIWTWLSAMFTVKGTVKTSWGSCSISQKNTCSQLHKLATTFFSTGYAHLLLCALPTALLKGQTAYGHRFPLCSYCMPSVQGILPILDYIRICSKEVSPKI